MRRLILLLLVAVACAPAKPEEGPCETDVDCFVGYVCGPNKHCVEETLQRDAGISDGGAGDGGATDAGDAGHRDAGADPCLTDNGGCGPAFAGTCHSSGAVVTCTCEDAFTLRNGRCVDVCENNGGCPSTEQCVHSAAHTSTCTTLPDAGADFAQYQFNAGHTGYKQDAQLQLPLRQRWSVDVGGFASYSIVTAGKVITTVSSSAGLGSPNFNHLIALDEQTGEISWGPIELDDVYNGAACAAADGIVVAQAENGPMTAWSAANGTPIWSRTDVGDFGIPLTIAGGRVFGVSNTRLMVLSLLSGQTLWENQNGNGGEGTVAVAGSLLFAPRENARAYDVTTGFLVWESAVEHDAWGQISDGRYVFSEGVAGSGNVKIDARTGEVLGTFNGRIPPTIAGERQISVIDQTVGAWSTVTGLPLWQFDAQKELVFAPVVINDTVFVGAADGQVLALDLSSGALRWTGDAGGTLRRRYDLQSNSPPGFGEGDGLLLVPAGNSVVAYESDPTDGGLSDAGAEDAGVDAGSDGGSFDAGPLPSGPQAHEWRIDAHHTGAQVDPALMPPLREVWSIELGEPISAPLIVNGHALVTFSSPDDGSFLVELDLASGRVLWGPIQSGSRQEAHIAYDDGTIFLIDERGTLQALEEATGAQRWVRTFPYQYSFASLAAAHGEVVLTAAGTGGTGYGVSESTGALLWIKNLPDDTAVPIIEPTFTWLSDGCALWKISPQGAELDSTSFCRDGPGSNLSAMALYRDRLYVSSTGSTNVFDVPTWQVVGTLPSLWPPAFHGDAVIAWSSVTPGFKLEAFSVSTRQSLWTFTDEHWPASPPLVVNDVVYFETVSGVLYAIDVTNGQKLWSLSLGGTNDNPNPNFFGLSEGQGRLLVPVGSTLKAFATAPP